MNESTRSIGRISMTGEVVVHSEEVVEMEIDQRNSPGNSKTTKIIDKEPTSLDPEQTSRTSISHCPSEAEDAPATPTPPSILLKVQSWAHPTEVKNRRDLVSPKGVSFRGITQQSGKLVESSPPPRVTTARVHVPFDPSDCSTSSSASLSLGDIKAQSEASMSPYSPTKPSVLKSPGYSRSEGNLSFRAFRRNSSAMFIEWVDDSSKGPEESSLYRRIWKKLVDTYKKNEVFILVVLAIVLARAYPPLGAKYLYPHITSTWLAVIFIFVMAGLGLRTEKFSEAIQRLKFNIFVQSFSFGLISIFVFATTRVLIEVNVINKGLADGMVICACLPMTISSVAVLTKTSGGDEAAAIFNSAFGSMLSVFMSPALILTYLGVSGNVNIIDVFFKLAIRVVAPVMIGQILQKKSKWAIKFVATHGEFFRRAQLYSVIWIVYTVFCLTFQAGNNTRIVDIFTMLLMQLIFLITFMCMSWMSLKLLFPNEPKLRVMGLFGCTQKTMAMGVPLIGAIYENDPLVGLYTLPLLVWYPLQLVVGSFVSPRLKTFVATEKWRLLLEEGRESKGDADSDNAACSDGDQTDSFSLSSDSEDASDPNQAADVELGQDFEKSSTFPPQATFFLHESDDVSDDSTVQLNGETFCEFNLFTPSAPTRKLFRPCPDSGGGADEPVAPVHEVSTRNLFSEPEKHAVSTRNLFSEPEKPLSSAQKMVRALPPPPL